MLTETALLPDACAIRRSHAHDIAEALAKVLRDGAYPLIRLYLSPNGIVGYGTAETADDLSPLCLVGTYTEEATPEQIAEDILAFEREAIA